MKLMLEPIDEPHSYQDTGKTTNHAIIMDSNIRIRPVNVFSFQSLSKYPVHAFFQKSCSSMRYQNQPNELADKYTNNYIMPCLIRLNKLVHFR